MLKNFSKNWHNIFLLILILATFCVVIPPRLRAATVDELRSNITSKSNQIKALEAEIAQYKDQLGKTSQQSKSFTNEVRRLETEIKKLNKEIDLTQAQIGSAELQIQELGVTIQDKETAITQKKKAIGETIRSIQEEESNSLIEVLLNHPDLSTFFTNLEHIQNLDSSIKTRLAELKDLKFGLETEKQNQEARRTDLQNYQSVLGDQKSLEEQTRKSKGMLLTQSKNQETTYQQMIKKREVDREHIEAEIAKIEDELRKTIDPDSLPNSGRGVLAWPVKGAAVLTQSFGNTPDSQVLYNGKPHNGIDIAAPTGTLVYSAEAGTVAGIGNTDQYSGCLSYGKWLVIKHGNNLSTLYGHMSLIKVNKGDTVTRGQLIGYSGATGYATGPHLHFTVYDSSTVQFRSSSIPGSNCQYLPYGGYLNPLAYL